MRFHVHEAVHTVGDKALPIWALENTANGDHAWVYPSLGFNCFRWRSGGRDILYDDDTLFTTGRPSRVGIPILFPFPNRIRDASFTWKDKSYDLPITDAGGKHAIHGFACRNAWRVVDRGADGKQAWLTGEFWTGQDAPALLPHWPADHRLRVTITLQVGGLSVTTTVENPDDRDLPFGLGFHPYFRLDAFPPLAPEAVPIEAPASSYWELHESLPTGNRRPLDARRDLNRPRPAGEMSLDDVLTGLPAPAVDGWRQCGRVGALRVAATASFGNLVVFNPPHRKAICLEPYTCVTDAVNLAVRGIDTGLLVLPPGQSWHGAMALSLE